MKKKPGRSIIKLIIIIPTKRKLNQCTVPAQEEYEQALTIAQKAVENHYGPEALISLGDYQVGVIYCIQENVDGVKQKQWDFLFTTDPEYLSDGYRVQFRQNTDENLNDGITELSVEHANVGNG